VLGGFKQHELEIAVPHDFNRWDPKAHIMENDGNGMWKKVELYVFSQRWSIETLMEPLSVY